MIDEEDNTESFFMGLIQGHPKIMTPFRVHVSKRFIKKPYRLFIMIGRSTRWEAIHTRSDQSMHYSTYSDFSHSRWSQFCHSLSTFEEHHRDARGIGSNNSRHFFQAYSPLWGGSKVLYQSGKNLTSLRNGHTESLFDRWWSWDYARIDASFDQRDIGWKWNFEKNGQRIGFVDVTLEKWNWRWKIDWLPGLHFDKMFKMELLEENCFVNWVDMIPYSLLPYKFIVKFQGLALKFYLRFYWTVLEFGLTFNLDGGLFSFYPKRYISLTILRPWCRRYTRQVKPLPVYFKESDIDLLVKLYHETLSLIACVGNSRLECFVRGTPKSYGKYQNE